MKKIAQRKGLVAWMALAVVLLGGGVDLVWDGATHVGPGWWHFSDYSDNGGGESGDKWDKLSEKQYKRQCYLSGGILCVFGGLLAFGVIAEWRKRDGLEKSWKQTIENPLNVQDIRLHPENYRDDFKEWIKENHPSLLLQLKPGNPET